MWKFMREPKTCSPAEKKTRTFGAWHFILIVFVVTWMISAYVFLKDGVDDVIHDVSPAIVLDEHGKINLFPNLFEPRMRTNKIQVDTNSTMPSIVVKPDYHYGDIVIIKYFYVGGVVLSKSAVGDDYTVMYKDHNHVLQKISLPRTMLLSPTNGALNPISLMVD